MRAANAGLFALLGTGNMRQRIAKNARFSSKDKDLGGGFYLITEKHGSCVWYFAAHLESPGGYVTKVGRFKRFDYARDALAQVAAWREEDKAS